MLTIPMLMKFMLLENKKNTFMMNIMPDDSNINETCCTVPIYIIWIIYNIVHLLAIYVPFNPLPQPWVYNYLSIKFTMKHPSQYISSANQIGCVGCQWGLYLPLLYILNIYKKSQLFGPLLPTYLRLRFDIKMLINNIKWTNIFFPQNSSANNYI